MAGPWSDLVPACLCKFLPVGFGSFFDKLKYSIHTVSIEYCNETQLKSIYMEMNTKTALDLGDVMPLVIHGKPGVTLPSALTSELLDAANHDLWQFFQENRVVDSEGNPFVTGPYCLVMKLIADKGMEIDKDEMFDFLRDYQLELELESLRRLHANLDLDNATLLTIFEPDRCQRLREMMWPSSVFLH